MEKEGIGRGLAIQGFWVGEDGGVASIIHVTYSDGGMGIVALGFEGIPRSLSYVLGSWSCHYLGITCGCGRWLWI